MSNKERHLNDRKSTGGEIAANGFTYQDAFVLHMLPEWLANESFAGFEQERAEDIEAKFFSPTNGETRRAFQAKDQQIRISDLREILNNFKNLDEQGKYERFGLICSSVDQNVKTIITKLARIRSREIPLENTQIANSTLSDFHQSWDHLNLDVPSDWILDKVFFVSDFVDNNLDFNSNLGKHIPIFAEMSLRELNHVISSLQSFITRNKKSWNPRNKVEQVLLEHIDDITSGRIHVRFSEERQSGVDGAMYLPWESYFDFDSHIRPDAVIWNDNLLPQLHATKTWLTQNRREKKLLIPKHALSTAFAVGYTFRAVTEYTIDVEQNGEIWSTDAHPNSETETIKLYHDYDPNSGEQLVFSIGVARNIADQVIKYVSASDLAEYDQLHLHTESAFSTPDQINRFSQEVKNHFIDNLMRDRQYAQIHLFYAGPFHAAVFLAHRLNGVASIQCYEWDNKSNIYFPTCMLQ